MAKAPDPLRSLGFALVDWIETFCVHGPGDVEGQRVHLDDEFAAFVIRAYALDRYGKRRIRRAVISRPKGRAKSELAAFLSVAEGLAPVRFSHWAKAGEVSSWGYAYAAGEPVGQVVTRPEVLCLATELGQAGNTYDAVFYMLHPETCAPELRETFGKVDVGLTRINLPGGGSITPESAADSSKDGGKETFVVADESHLWVLPRLKRLHQTVVRNLLKRKIASGWMLETTTMYAPGEGSVAEGTHEYAKAVAEGRLTDRTLLFDHRQASPEFDPDKRRDRIAGLKFVYGPAAAWMDLPAISASYDDPQTIRAEWVRYWFNRPESLQGSWLPQLEWDLCAKPRPIQEHADVVLALDGSFNGDATALVAIEVGDIPHVAVEGLWERPPGRVEWQVPILDVEDKIRLACMKWNVKEVTCDPYRWARSMQVMEADGIPVQEFPQSASRMTPATQRATDLVLNAQLTHDADPRLTRHVSNAVLKVDSRGHRLYKENRNSDRKIDLAVAMVMGLERAAWWHANGFFSPSIAFV